MTTRTIGKMPANLGSLSLPAWREFCFVQDLPILTPESGSLWLRVPSHVQALVPMAMMVRNHLLQVFGERWLKQRYMYLTAKHTHVCYGQHQTREGWHTDGFGTDDLAFLWCDSTPTLVLDKPMIVSTDDREALAQMQAEGKRCLYGQAYNGPRYITQLDTNRLYMLDDQVIHSPAPAERDGFRRFAKISVSKYPYDLEGNAVNDMLPTNWSPTRKRGEHRNNPENIA